MIHIANNSDCCGCGACAQRCPVQCIRMEADCEGFLYPQADQAVCVECGLCEKVCPVLNQPEPVKPQAVYAAKNPDEAIREASSSGGVFTALSEAVLARGGVVFGARFDAHWEVMHDWTETSEGLAAFRGSKYVQSRMGENFKACERFLKQGREVLFSGTPCQIAGLKRFLRREYDKLLTVDVVCHGVPSPLVWSEYLKEICAGKPDRSFERITDISFRNKAQGWKRYGFQVLAADPVGGENEVLFATRSGRNSFMRGFLCDLYLRPSCHACPARSGKSGSDLTIGDFWGIGNYRPDYDDDRGTSAVLANTRKGAASLEPLPLDKIGMPYESVVAANPCAERSVPATRYRRMFWSEFPRTGIKAIEKVWRKQNPLTKRAAAHLKHLLKRIIRYK